MTMKKLFITIILLLVPNISFAGETLHITGSTTVLPVVSTAAKIYHKAHPEITITVSGGGSGVGIAGAISKRVSIGMASRTMTPEEKKKFSDKGKVIVIAHDAVAVVISKAVYEGGVHNLSIKQIADIYHGRIKNWKDVGGSDSKILVIDKEASRGTRHVFAEAILGDAHARAEGATVIAGSNNEEQAIVTRSNNAIGMLSRAWTNDAVREVGVGEGDKAILPTLEHVSDGTYPISRALFLILPEGATAGAQKFVDYILSPAGQKIVKQSGYLPLN